MFCEDPYLSRGLHLSELSSAIALSDWSLGLKHFMGQTLPQGYGTIDLRAQKHPKNQALRRAFSGWCSELVIGFLEDVNPSMRMQIL